MLKFKYLIIIVSLISISGLTYATTNLQAGKSFKESFTESLNTTAQQTGHAEADGSASFFGTKEPALIVSTLIAALLSFLGVIFLILLIYGGYLWMTDRGEEKQVTKAKSIIKNALIGLVIVLAAYAITSFVMGKIHYGASLIK